MSKLSLQKILFLVSRHQRARSFDFLPYHYGCYSYQIAWDISALHKYGYICESETQYELVNQHGFTSQLKPEDKSAVLHVFRTYGGFSSDELIKETYVNYPYYAIKSRIADRVLTTAQYQQVQQQVPRKEAQTLFTMGYEGLSLEQYFNKLIINDVKVLCDVRRNPLSQKVGFSKGTLQKVCDALDIVYVHLPELGIESSKRQSLHTQRDYDELFADYEANHLVHQGAGLDKIEKLLADYGRVTLTCFEASHCQCHRGRVAHALVNRPNFDVPLKHL
ncbi:DUF488 domain-containing protein [Hymenobacter fodinae]|uniref:DUF488 domain-containing protein n=1 Tax=Hymenobacter fodinae TaxID=2510796 RepID=UPI001AEC373E|nr:DUF488 domain-containing protein [Hymenobacter fodinae]